MPDSNFIEVKSKFYAEFRRFGIDPTAYKKFKDFHSLLESRHKLQGIPFVVQYVDSINSDLLPINNDENYATALSACKSKMYILLQRKGESYGELYGYKCVRQKSHKGSSSILRSYGNEKLKPPGKAIELRDDFQLVSSIVDVKDIPKELRRVRLMRTPNKQFGLYIRNGLSQRHTASGYQTIPSFFVSRLDPNGIAYGTGLLAEDDEIIEVNGIEVNGKTMDQVTDMMVANSSNLIITVRPADQQTCLTPTIPGKNTPHDQQTLQVPPSSTPRVSSSHDNLSEYTDSMHRSHAVSDLVTDGEEDDVSSGLITL